MLRKLRRFPSPALVISCIALAISLGGVGYAAVVLPANSVGTKQLKDNAVVGSKVKLNSLGGADINEATLDSTILQKRITGTCPDQAVQAVNQDGTVTCVAIGTDGGGDITDVVAGNGLSGGGSSGSATLDVAAGTGISLQGDVVGLDLTYADGRYLLSSAVQLTCGADYVAFGGQCFEAADHSGYTYAGAAVHCAAEGGRVPTYGELVAVQKAGVLVSASPSILLDWTSNSTADDEALYINSIAGGENWDGVRATTTSSYARCVRPVRVVGLTGP